MEKDTAPTIHDLYPNLSDEEVPAAEDGLGRYLELALRVFERTHADPQRYPQAIAALTLRQGQLADRLSRLTDAFLDGTIEKPLFEERKVALLLERKTVEEKMAELRQGGTAGPDRLSEFLELAGSASCLYGVSPSCDDCPPFCSGPAFVSMPTIVTPVQVGTRRSLWPPVAKLGVLAVAPPPARPAVRYCLLTPNVSRKAAWSSSSSRSAATGYE